MEIGFKWTQSEDFPRNTMEKCLWGKKSKMKYLPFSAEALMLGKTGSQIPIQRMGVQENKEKRVEGMIHG